VNLGDYVPTSVWVGLLVICAVVLAASWIGTRRRP
jgi:hypothetical protein